MTQDNDQMPDCRYGHDVHGRQIIIERDEFEAAMQSLWEELRQRDRRDFLNLHVNIIQGILRHVCTWENLIDAVRLYLHCGLDLYSATKALAAIGLFYDHGFTLPRWGGDECLTSPSQ